MGAVTTIEAAAPVVTFEAWLNEGRDLAAQRKDLDWRIGDWLATGQQQFSDQVEFGFLAEKLGMDPKRLKQAEKIATAFPEHLRAGDVSFEVHAKLAALPEDKRLPTLQQASREHWDERAANRVVTQYRHQAAMFEDEDPERLATLIYRAWNNAPADIREHAWPLIQTAAKRGFVIIDEEEAIDG